MQMMTVLILIKGHLLFCRSASVRLTPPSFFSCHLLISPAKSVFLSLRLFQPTFSVVLLFASSLLLLNSQTDDYSVLVDCTYLLSSKLNELGAAVVSIKTRRVSVMNIFTWALLWKKKEEKKHLKLLHKNICLNCIRQTEGPAPLCVSAAENQYDIQKVK